MAFEKLSRFFGMTDEDDYDTTDNQPVKIDNDSNGEKLEVASSNVVPMNNNTRSVSRKIVISEPKIYADAKEISTNLLNNQAVIVNFTQMEEAQSRRVIDFLTGTVFAIKGEIQRVGDQIFLCTPPKFEIEGSISDILQSDKDFD
ncbi:cell division protein SepF [Lapidilactobacillus bayanensis]|uniref:cell division protein SepF n=1 Tax=Lapidilactobacillus bayanensis TaxID=2485998 RepID=UPI000F7897D3|nr:cell division protein SepF [Lapidilactobacillus bayanensis]